MNLLIKLLLTAVSVVILAYFLPGVNLEGNTFMTALKVAAVLALLNVFVKPILVLFTLPATILTLGLFLFVINACIILLADKFIDDFGVSSFWTAMLFSVLLSFLQSLLNSFLKEDNK